MIRAKGFFWLGTRSAVVGEMSQAGRLRDHQPAGYWWAAMPEEHWPDDPNQEQRIMDRWDDDFGDRRQELVFIGVDMDEADLRRRLDACLMSTAEIESYHENAASIPDAFPAWDLDGVPA